MVLPVNRWYGKFSKFTTLSERGRKGLTHIFANYRFTELKVKFAVFPFAYIWSSSIRIDGCFRTKYLKSLNLT